MEFRCGAATAAVRCLQYGTRAPGHLDLPQKLMRSGMDQSTENYSKVLDLLKLGHRQLMRWSMYRYPGNRRRTAAGSMGRQHNQAPRWGACFTGRTGLAC